MTITGPKVPVRSAVLALFAVMLAGPLEPTAAQSRRIELATALDSYLQGRADDALGPVQRATRDVARDVRQQLVLQGNAWVDAVPADRSRRAYAAAAFALEHERIRAEAGEWAANGEKDCAGRCVIEWACTLLASRGAPDDAERSWMLASIALVGGVRDWSFLQVPFSARKDANLDQGHIHHALARFPDDARFRLVRAFAFGARNLIASERGAPGSTERVPGPIIVGPAFLNENLQRSRTRAADYARQELEALFEDASVGAEARMWVGYLHWAAGEDREALAMQSEAAAAAAEPDVKYLTHFLAAQAAQALGHLPAAESHYRSALAARPHSQSATLGLAALLYARGEGREAYDLAAASRSNLPRDDDPWRLFLYGDFRKLPALVGDLRRRVTP
jgi:tetratricopeptide (TPR) repeat protein